MSFLLLSFPTPFFVLHCLSLEACCCHVTTTLIKKGLFNNYKHSVRAFPSSIKENRNECWRSVASSFTLSNICCSLILSDVSAWSCFIAATALVCSKIYYLQQISFLFLRPIKYATTRWGQTMSGISECERRFLLAKLCRLTKNKFGEIYEGIADEWSCNKSDFKLVN